jgi:predicted amidohydrolase
MGGKAVIASFAMNQRFLYGKTEQEMADIAIGKIDSVKGYHPDLICLPEIFLETGGDRQNGNWAEISQQTVKRLCNKAGELQCYIIASVYESSDVYDGMRYNCALLIDRQGKIIGKYRKQHTVVEESLNSHVIPGKECPVFDTDFGRIGMLICFDIGWRDAWKEMADKGAQMVVWLSAYDGGNLLNTYAAHNMYYVVSSVRTDHARVIDLTGRTIAMSSDWNGLCIAAIDLETTLFHIDQQWQKIDEVRAILGDKVTINSYSEENVFTIESNDLDWPMKRICEEFRLVSYKDYHAEAMKLQNEWKTRYPETHRI